MAEGVEVPPVEQQALEKAPDLAGTWRLEVVLASTAKVPVVGDVEGASVSVLEVTIARDGDGWTQRQEVCGVRVKGGGKVARTTLPEAFVRSIPPRTYPAAIDARDGRWHYRADTGLEAVGWDPSAARFPERPGAAGVVDSDGDGDPGATIRMRVLGLGTEEMYIAQRAHTVLDGWVVDPDRIEGRVNVLALDQTTLGASHPLLDRPSGIQPDEASSRFTLTRVPPGTACAAPEG